jgi:hypothetical protein
VGEQVFGERGEAVKIRVRKPQPSTFRFRCGFECNQCGLKCCDLNPALSRGWWRRLTDLRLELHIATAQQRLSI